MPDHADTDASPDTDPGRFVTHWYDGRGFRQAYVHEGQGGVPVLLVHGWPETKRIWWRVIEPLVAAGFEVIVPDLRGFGESEVAADGFGDTPSSSRDLHALVHDHLGHDHVVLVGGDFGGPIVQDIALRFGDFADRMVLFNSPLPYDKQRMAGLRSRSLSATDYFIRQGTDADALAAELVTPEQRQRYIATFYSSRFWAHPGAFDDPAIAFHTEPFADGDQAAGVVRALRERVRPGPSQRAGADRPQPRHADGHPLRPVRPRHRARLRPAWPRSSSTTTSARSCSATAATSSRGRRRTPSSPPPPPSAATSSPSTRTGSRNATSGSQKGYRLGRSGVVERSVPFVGELAVVPGDAGVGTSRARARAARRRGRRRRRGRCGRPTQGSSRHTDRFMAKMRATVCGGGEIRAMVSATRADPSGGAAVASVGPMRSSVSWPRDICCTTSR